MPHGTEQRKVRADLKTQVLSLLLLLGVAGSASAAPGHSICQSDSCAERFETVDYTVSEDDAAKSEESIKDREVLKQSSLALTTRQDTTVRREQFLNPDLKLPVFDDETTDPVARLLERRALEKTEEAEQEVPAMKSALPGVDAEELRLFREKMYRTDI